MNALLRFPFSTVWFVILLLINPMTGLAQQDEPPAETTPPTDAVPSEVNTQETMAGLLERLKELQQQLTKLDRAEEPKLQILLEKREEEAKALQQEIETIDAQIHAIATGVDDAAYTDINDDTPVDLNYELQQIVQPLILLLRSATEGSRQIEDARNALRGAEQQHEMAARALENLNQLDASAATEIDSRLEDYRALWSDRSEAAQDRIAALEQQLQAKLEPDIKPSSGRSTNFLRDRGLSLLLGIGALCLVIFVLRLLGKIIGRALQKTRKKPLNLPLRAGALIYRVAVFIAGMVAMLAVFNWRNDWLLMGLSLILLLSAGWTLVKMLPDLIEQIRLLLNLGAVQENERVMFDGVPWFVKTLDFYTVLTNPALRGGELALPVRELSGLHSRPTVTDEDWFPSQEGDWVLLEDDKIAQVKLQTPEFVQLQRLGGAIITIPSPAFFESPPMNLSHGYRVELEFGIDYKHQAQSTTNILQTMRQWLEQELPKALPVNTLKNLEVEFFSAAESSLNYEIEADLDGSAACEYEEVGRIISSLLVDACNTHGWGIPFQQITIHSAAESAVG